MNSTRPRPAVAQIILMAWALLCGGLYAPSAAVKSVIREDVLGSWAALAPKLARIALLPYAGSLARGLLTALACSWAFAGLGDILLRVAPLARELRQGTSLRKMAYLASAFVAGQGVLSIVFFGLALRGLLLPVFTVLILGAAALCGLPLAREYGRGAHLSPAALYRRFVGGENRGLLTLALFTIGVTLLFTVSRISFDASSAYFSDAKATALTHAARYFTTFGFTTSALQASIHYAAIIQLFGDTSARMYSWLAGLSVIALAVALAAELGLRRRARVVLLVLVVTTTSLMDLMGDGKVDLISAAPALAAIYWVVVNTDRRRDGWIVAGFLAGFAMAERPYNLFLMPAVIALLGVFEVGAWPGRKSPRAYRDLLGAWAWMAVAAIPWIVWIVISNWGLLGDPFAVITEYVRLRSGAYPLSFPANALWAFRLLYPLSVTFINHGQSLGNISPLFVGLLPLLFIKRVRDGIRASRTLRVSVAAAALTLLLWLIGTSMVFETRYVIFLWIMLYMPAALWISSGLQNGELLTRAFTGVALASLLIFLSARTVYFAIDTYSPVDAQANPHCYDMDRCVPFQVLNDQAAPGERVLQLNAFRYYLRTDLFECSSTHEDYDKLWALSHSDMTAYWTEAYRRGFRYVVFEWDYVVGHLYLGHIPSPGNTPAWLDLVPLYGVPGEKQVVYLLVAHNAPVQVETGCVNQAGTWRVGPLRVPGE